MTRLLKSLSIAGAVLFIGASLVIGAKTASAQATSFICHSYEPSASACQSYCMATYGDDYNGYHWNQFSFCCACVF